MTPKNFLIVRLGAMGDVIHAIPAVAALRRAAPESKITWVIDPRWRPLLAASLNATPGTDTMPLVDHIHLADTRSWSRRPFSLATLRSIFRLRRELRVTTHDAIIDLQGSIRSAIISRFASGKVFGSAAPRECPARWLYSKRVAIHASHVIEQAVEICSAAIGKRLTPQSAPLPRDLGAETWCDQFLAAHSQRNFAVITPGAGWGAKRWPADRYGEVAAGLANLGLADLGLTTLVNSGPGESHLAAEVVAASQGNAIPVECTLPQLIALLRCAAIFIGGDTGPLHLAAALHVPVVGLFGPTDPKRNGPHSTRAIVLRHPTSRRDHTRRSHPESGLLAIPAAAVLDAARTLLQQSNSGPHMTILQNFEAQ